VGLSDDAWRQRWKLSYQGWVLFEGSRFLAYRQMLVEPAAFVQVLAKTVPRPARPRIQVRPPSRPFNRVAMSATAR
jgi:hypothetical protein